MALKTLTDHNRERYDAYVLMTSSFPMKNGIACPQCGDELWDSDPLSTLTVSPPQKRTHCGGCSYTGTRLV